MNKKLLVDTHFMHNMTAVDIPEMATFSLLGDKKFRVPDTNEPYGYLNENIPWYWVSGTIDGGFKLYE